MTPLQIMHLRTAQSQRWITRARELEAAEATFKQSLPPHIRASLKSKRILLFKEMLEAAHYPDKAVADDMASGFHLVGHLDLPAGWAPDFRPRQISEADLSALSQDGNQQVIREVASSSSFTEELWQKSIEEVSKGWSEGPFSFDELPERAIISKRFAIQQGKKVRPHRRPVDSRLEFGIRLGGQNSVTRYGDHRRCSAFVSSETRIRLAGQDD